MCGPKYRRATWTLFVLQAFNQQTGINAIVMYFNRMLININEQTGTELISPVAGTYLMGITNTVGAILAVIPISRMGRKTIYLTGYLGMTILHVLVGLSQIYSLNMLQFVCILCFLLTFQIFQGGPAWLYFSETIVDASSGLVTLSMFINLFQQSLSMEFMMASSMGVSGTFFLFGGLCALGFFFVLAFMRETAGMTDL